MLSINMRIFKMVLLLFALFSGAFSLPLDTNSTEISSMSTLLPVTRSSGDMYDQRQNGTENYRIHVDGLVFVVAPVEALLLAANEPTLGLPQQTGVSKPQDKPKPDPEGAKPIPAPKSASRAGLRLSNLLAPFLRRIRQE